MWGLKDFAGVVLWCRTVFLKLFPIDRAISKILIVNSVIENIVLVLVNKSGRVQVTTL